MTRDAQGLIEVNAALVESVARQAHAAGQPCPLVVIAATWGRGCDQQLLTRLEAYRAGPGYNSSLVAVVPPEVAAQWLDEPALNRPDRSRPGFCQVIALAFGKRHETWLALDESTRDEGLF